MVKPLQILSDDVCGNRRVSTSGNQISDGDAYRDSDSVDLEITDVKNSKQRAIEDRSKSKVARRKKAALVDKATMMNPPAVGKMHRYNMRSTGRVSDQVTASKRKRRRIANTVA